MRNEDKAVKLGERVSSHGVFPGFVKHRSAVSMTKTKQLIIFVRR